ncbi:MAG TPA: SGNH/GDSL hydrolase family protein, partial [Candidatus Absconditabacterales bacterium]|nr:SGNH/GDSL hydrolase family protein [Candidatus Absconditabacterales bacterium]
LATVKGECNFENTREKGGEDKRYGKNGFYGRGYVQLTHKGNYRKFTKIIKKSGLKFKNNNGEILTEENLDLVKNPDTIIESNDLAAFILVYGMKNGTFTGKKLSDFINDQKTDFYNARSIINGMSSAPKKYEGFANEYLSSIEQEKIKNNEILAQNTSETIIYGDSHVGGIYLSGFSGKTNHYDGYDTGQLYNNISSLDLEGKKSLILYTGSNDITKNKIGSLKENLEKIKTYLDSKGVQLVLSAIPYNKSKQKEETDKINKIIKDFSKEKNLPLLDFNNSVQIASNEYANDGVHLNKKGYKKISEHIENQFA